MKKAVKALLQREYLLPIAGMLLTVILGLTFWAYQNDRLYLRLTEERIEELREEYPVQWPMTPAIVDMRILNIDKILDMSDSVAYALVEGERQGTLKVPLEVISDSHRKYPRGKQFLFEGSPMFLECYPKLEQGTRLVIPVLEYPDESGQLEFFYYSMYYVTRDGYVLSVYPEERFNDQPMTGHTLKYLMREFGKKVGGKGLY